MLYMVDHVDKIIIMDTRSVATNFTHELLGLTACIYRLCAEPIPKRRLITKLADLGENDEASIEQCLQNGH